MEEPADDRSFDAAWKALCSPLHQATTKEEIEQAALRRTCTVEDMMEYWNCLNVKYKSIPTIHITGTKGKGSTACFCSALLSPSSDADDESRTKIGLFTSPHLLYVGERIRINGKPISKALFAQVYWDVRDRLDSKQKQLPGYFRMLTLMALYVFQQLKVDVQILEVGMGGRYDATNVISQLQTRQRVCGVTLLDYDHVRILGNTLAQIAWEKGGIFGRTSGNSKNSTSKEEVSPHPSKDQDHYSKIQIDRAYMKVDTLEQTQKEDETATFFILDSNPDEVLQVMTSCAQVEGQGGRLKLIDADGAELRLQFQSLGLKGDHQWGNAQLAVALCRQLIQQTSNTTTTNLTMNLSNLQTAKWPGRCQHEFYKHKSKDTILELVLDGAHTPASLQTTLDFYQSIHSKNVQKQQHVLIFYTSPERNPVELLQLIATMKVQFHTVYMVPPTSGKPSPVTPSSAQALLEQHGIPIQTDLLPPSNSSTWQATLASIWKHLVSSTSGMTVISNKNSLSSILDELTTMDDNDTLSVLVTGSLYLVGSMLQAMEWTEATTDDAILLQQ